MSERGHSGRRAALLGLLLVAALGVALLVTMLPKGGSGARRAPVAPAPAARPAVPAGGAASVQAWDRVLGGSRLMVRAEDAVELVGKMTLQKGPDNEDVVGPDGKPATVSYVWCEYDGHEKMTPQELLRFDPGQHYAVFKFTVPADSTYYPWARVWWQDGCGNSMTLVLQRQRGKPLEVVVEDGTLKWWHWVPVAGEGGLRLEKGDYKLIVKNREDGARLSSILFSTRSYRDYKPETPEG